MSPRDFVQRVNFIVPRKGPLSMLGEVIVNRDIIDGIESFTIDESEPLTAYLQEAIDDCLPRGRRLYLPVGLYITGPLAVNPDANRGSIEIAGESWDGDIGFPARRGTNLKLLSNSNAGMFNIGDIADGDDVAPCLFENLRIHGNRDAQNQSSIQYAFDFLPMSGAGKGRAANIKRTYVESFLKGGLRIGTLRNAGQVEKVTILSSGGRIFGTAQAVSSNTMTLALAASAADGAYVGRPLIVTVSSGNGDAVSQLRTITGYVGATRVATVDSPWDTLPSGTVGYRINTVDGDAVLMGSCNDWRLEKCDFGGSTRNGVYGTGGGSADFVSCNTFTNDVNGLRWDSTATDMRWIGGSIDTNKGHGAVFVGSEQTIGIIYPRSLVNPTFRQNGLGKHDAFSDVFNGGDRGLTIENPNLVLGTRAATGGRRVKYFYANPNSNPTQLTALRYDKLRGTVFTTGTAQGGTSTTITLAAANAAASGRYNETVLTITAGTGSGQSGLVASYDGTTKIATMLAPWGVTPDATSVYEISAQPIYATALTDTPSALRGFQDDGVAIPTISAGTPGDLSVAINSTLSSMRWSRQGNRMTVDFDIAFVPTYTTASGVLIIGGLPLPSNANARSSGSLAYKQNVALPTNYDWAVPVVAAGSSNLNIRASGFASGVASALLNITAIASSASAVLRGSITYEI